MKIEGLTQRQVELCDMIWACDSESDIRHLENILHKESKEIAVLKELMIQEAFEEDLSLMERYPDAESMLERLKKDYL